MMRYFILVCMLYCCQVLGTAEESNRTVSAEVAKLLNTIARSEPQAAMEQINAYQGKGHPLLTLATAQTQWRLALITKDEKASATLRTEAEQTFNDALAADATLRQAHIGLAQCAAAKQDWLTASREAALGIDATFGNRQELVFLAQAAFNASDWRLASVATQQGILRFPDDPTLRRLELSVLLNAARYEEARQAVLAILDQSPHDISLWKQLAYVAQQTNRHDEALAALESAVLIKPDDRSNRRSLADMQLARHLPQAAYANYAMLIGTPANAASLNDPALMYTASRAASDAGHLEQGRQWLAAIPEQKQNRDLRILAARLAIQANDEKSAAASLDVLIGSGENDPSILAWAGSLAQQRGDVPTAELLYLTAAKGDSPAAAAASLRLVALYITQKRLDDARVALALHVNKYPADQQAKELQQRLGN